MSNRYEKIKILKNHLDDTSKLKFEDFIFDEVNGIRGAPRQYSFIFDTIKYFSKYRKSIKILEIDSFVRSSLLTWIEASNQYLDNAETYIVDPLKPFLNEDYNKEEESKVSKIERIVKNNFAYNIFLKNIELMKKKLKNINIIYFRNYSEEILPLLSKNTFDIIYRWEPFFYGYGA